MFSAVTTCSPIYCALLYHGSKLQPLPPMERTAVHPQQYVSTWPYLLCIAVQCVISFPTEQLRGLCEGSTAAIQQSNNKQPGGNLRPLTPVVWEATLCTGSTAVWSYLFYRQRRYIHVSLEMNMAKLDHYVQRRTSGYCWVL